MSFLCDSPRSTIINDKHSRVNRPIKLLHSESQNHLYSGGEGALSLIKSMKESSAKLFGTPKSAFSQKRPQTGASSLALKLPGKQNKCRGSSKHKSLSSAKVTLATSTVEDLSASNYQQRREILEVFEARCADSQVRYGLTQIYFCKELSAKFLQKIERCCKDRRINLSNSWIGFQALLSLCDFISSARLCHVNLEKNQIGDAGAVELSKMLANSSTIVYLNISSNSIKEAGTEHIFGALRYNNTLVELDISSKEGLNKNCIRSGTRSLKESLKQNCTLAILNLANTQLNMEGLNYLTAGLKQNSGVASLNIGQNELGQGSVQSIMHILREHELMQLSLAGNRMGNDSIKLLMEFVCKFNRSLRIQRLNLSGNEISQKSSSVMFDVLRKNSSLKMLNLSHNSFCHENRMLALLLEENSDMQLLNLENCNINAAFACSLGDGLRKSRSLQTLLLGNNKLDLECISQLLRSLEVNGSLERLELRNCQLEDAAAEVISDVLPRNKVLKQLNLSDNYITDAGATKLLEGVSTNQSMQELVLKSNFVSYKLLKAICDKLNENRFAQVQEKIPRYRQKLENIQQSAARDSDEVQHRTRYLADKKERLISEIASLERDLVSKQALISQVSTQHQQELKDADHTIRQMQTKLSISNIINDNIDRKIRQARACLQKERKALTALTNS